MCAQDFSSDNPGWGSQCSFLGLWFQILTVCFTFWCMFAPVPEEVLLLVNWKVDSVVAKCLK